MNAYVYQAALLCEDCGKAVREQLALAAIDNDILNMPTPDTDERKYDSDRYPKGPYPNGGGESDSPQHCDTCNVFLENPLTDEGVSYVRKTLAREFGRGSKSSSAAMDAWREFYRDDVNSERQSRMVETDNSSRECIGCECHQVPWNQGSDYCDECMTDAETQRSPHDARED